MLGFALTLLLVQVCPDFTTPAISPTTDVPPKMEIACPWDPGSCQIARLMYVEAIIRVNVDGSPRTGLVAICSRVPEAAPICGDGEASPEEECDDGNLIDGD